MLILTIMVLFSDSTKTEFHDSQLKKKYLFTIYWGLCGHSVHPLSGTS